MLVCARNIEKDDLVQLKGGKSHKSHCDYGRANQQPVCRFQSILFSKSGPGNGRDEHDNAEIEIKGEIPNLGCNERVDIGQNMSLNTTGQAYQSAEAQQYSYKWNSSLAENLQVVVMIQESALTAIPWVLKAAIVQEWYPHKGTAKSPADVLLVVVTYHPV